jgi:hypothetical protein
VATERLLIVKVATPLALTTPVPRMVAPSLKVTLPVGTGPAFGVIEALKVTLWPKTEGLALLVSAVVVVFCTNCVMIGEVLVT